MSPKTKPQPETNAPKAELLHKTSETAHTTADFPPESSSDEHDQEAQVLRAQLVVYALEKVEKHRLMCVKEDHDMPTDDLLDAIESFEPCLVVYASCPCFKPQPTGRWSIRSPLTRATTDDRTSARFLRLTGQIKNP